MAILDQLFGAEEDQLAKTAPGESQNLDMHTELCARRYKTLSDRLRSQSRLIWIVIVLLIINLGPEKFAILSKIFSTL